MSIVKKSTRGVSREKWLEMRKQGIGGSEAAALVGLSEYSTPYTVWCDKTGRIAPKEDNEAMRQGRDLEEYVAFRFSEATAKKVRRSNYMYTNTDFPFALGNVDRLIVGENAGLECKTTSILNLKKFKNGEFPDRYYVQCMHYMAVTGADRWYLAVLVLGQDFKVFTIERDEEEISALMAAEKDFWENYVLTDTEPPSMGTKGENEVLNEIYPEAGEKEIFDDTAEGLLKDYIDLKAMVKHYEKRLETVEQEIKKTMGDCYRLNASGYVANWKNASRSTFDYKRLIEERPDEDFSEYFKTTNYRKFDVKAPKGA